MWDLSGPESNCVSCFGKWILYHWATREAPLLLSWVIAWPPLVDSLSISGKYKCLVQRAFTWNRYMPTSSLIACSIFPLLFHPFFDASVNYFINIRTALGYRIAQNGSPINNYVISNLHIEKQPRLDKTRWGDTLRAGWLSSRIVEVGMSKSS